MTNFGQGAFFFFFFTNLRPIRIEHNMQENIGDLIIDQLKDKIRKLYG